MDPKTTEKLYYVLDGILKRMHAAFLPFEPYIVQVEKVIHQYISGTFRRPEQIVQALKGPLLVMSMFLCVYVLIVVFWRCAVTMMRVMRSSTPSKLPILSTDSVKLMSDIVDGDSLEFRDKVKKVFAKEKEVFMYREEEYDTNMAAQRKAALKRIKRFQDHKLISVHDIKNDPQKFIAAHELVCQTDPSFVYFFSVHFNLFGGSVLKLGTKEHHDKYLEAIDRVDLPGCFALTEFRHGVNSGFFMDTTATYDKSTKMFNINTPNTGAQKNWISFCADQARMAVVFAKLTMDDKDEGVHAFLVEIRDKSGKPTKGVRIADVGHKPTLNGNDNGRLWFDNVKVPRGNLLNRYSNVDEDGKYTSEITKIRERFLKVSDQLMSGRMCIGAASVTLSKMCVLAALRFSINRTQVRPKGGEMNLYGHLSQRRALLPILAQSYTVGQAVNYVKRRYAQQTDKDRAEVLRLVCAFKAYCTCEAVVHSGICREKTGGQGLISHNKIAELNNVAASLVVVEGDSMLLAQKVSKELLDEARKSGNIAFMISGFIKSKYYNGVIASMTDGRPASNHTTLFAARVHFLTMHLASALYSSSKKMPLLEAWSRKHLDIVLQLHTAFVEEMSHRKMMESISKCKDAKVRKMLQCMCDLFAVSKLEKDLGWFMTYTSMTKMVARDIREHVNFLCEQIQERDCLVLLEALGFPNDINTIPIAVGNRWEKIME